MRVPIFVTVAVVRLRIIAEGLAALYQIPMAVLSAPGGLSCPYRRPGAHLSPIGSSASGEPDQRAEDGMAAPF